MGESDIRKKKPNIIIARKPGAKEGAGTNARPGQTLIKPNVKRAEPSEEKKEAMNKLSVLVKELVGDRSIRKAADDSRVTASYISGIINAQFLPSAEILKKLAAPSANPQNGVTLEDLMIAAGYQQDYVSEALGRELYVEKPEGEKGELSDIRPNDELMKRLLVYQDAMNKDRNAMAHAREEMKAEVTKFMNMALGVLHRCLSEKGIRYQNAPDIPGIRGFKPDMAIFLELQPVSMWWFDIKYIDDDEFLDGLKGSMMIRSVLGRYMFIGSNVNRKISLVVGNKDFFDKVVSFKDKLSYRGDLSVILVNKDDFTIAEEVYLAHYAENGTESEVYIV